LKRQGRTLLLPRCRDRPYQQEPALQARLPLRSTVADGPAAGAREGAFPMSSYRLAAVPFGQAPRFRLINANAPPTTSNDKVAGSGTHS